MKYNSTKRTNTRSWRSFISSTHSLSLFYNNRTFNLRYGVMEEKSWALQIKGWENTQTTSKHLNYHRAGEERKKSLRKSIEKIKTKNKTNTSSRVCAIMLIVPKLLLEKKKEDHLRHRKDLAVNWFQRIFLLISIYTQFGVNRANKKQNGKPLITKWIYQRKSNNSLRYDFIQLAYALLVWDCQHQCTF